MPRRSRVELELGPGASATEHLAVHDLGDEAVTFAITASDGYLTSARRTSAPCEGSSIQ
ncbi:hypothetical protein [Agromyces aureus]|uniref:hypothetical protein n=1 Tax=Agromyces aureus TaxID=453304 RepID=UPI000ADC6116|nr:hypothetical protein [Agromyces aureus]